MTKIWIGKRESDVIKCDYFDYSITYWGTNENRNFAYSVSNRSHAKYSKEFIEFVCSKLDTIIIDSNNLYEIHFYNNSLAYKLLDYRPSYRKFFKNTNSIYLHNILRHKTLSRIWLSNFVNVPAFSSIGAHESTLQNLEKKFPLYKEFVIQENYSGGGTGTYFLSAKSEKRVRLKMQQGHVYLVSPFYKNNISLSCTILVDSKSCIVLPVSKQLLKHNQDRIEYCGNIFLHNNEDISKKIKEKAQIIGNQLCLMGYKGICGFDFISTKSNDIFLIEVNPRYQGSSYVINNALISQGLPSLFELNSLCFQGELPQKIICELNKLNIQIENHVINESTKKEIVPSNAEIFTDGYELAKSLDKGVYLYRYIISNPC